MSIICCQTIIMKAIFVCLLIIATAAAAPRIVGGKPANITEVPWQAQVNWWIWDFVFECGAAIIGPNTALTAGHCVGGQWSRRIEMVSDSTKVDFGNWHDVIKYIRHPDFAEHPDDFYDNDIAIVWVAQPFVNESYTIARAINISAQEPKQGDQALISGYGFARDNATEDILHTILVPIIDKEECNETYGGKIGPDKICGGLLESGQGVCARDDGGPVVVNGALIGIVSSRNTCGEAGKPEVYTNIAYFKDWIEEQQQLFESERKLSS